MGNDLTQSEEEPIKDLGRLFEAVEAHLLPQGQQEFEELREEVKKRLVFPEGTTGIVIHKVLLQVVKVLEKTLLSEKWSNIVLREGQRTDKVGAVVETHFISTEPKVIIPSKGLDFRRGPIIKA